MLVVLSVVLALAVAYDLLERRIPNCLIAGGTVLAFALAAWHGGAAELGAALAAMLLSLAAIFPFFALRMVGAGDAKLFAVVGGFVGLDALLPVWLYTVLAGGVLGVVGIGLSHSFPQARANIKLLLISLTHRVPGVEMPLEAVAVGTSARIPYAVAIAAGAAIWMVGRS